MTDQNIIKLIKILKRLNYNFHTNLCESTIFFQFKGAFKGNYALLEAKIDVTKAEIITHF